MPARRRDRRERRPRRRYALAIGLPILLTAFSQFEFVQKSTCVLAELPWGVGQCEVIADLLAPMWALAIIPIATLLRRLVPRHGSPQTVSDRESLGKLGSERWVIWTTWGATWGAMLIVLLSYTREWERFGEQPGLAWYTLVVIGVFALLLVPVWWIRRSIHERGATILETAAVSRSLDRYLFVHDDTEPVRWPHVVAFAGITVAVAYTVLGQFNSLLLGMHLPGAPAVGIGSIAAIFEMDLAGKTDVILERVATWRSYTGTVGDRFGSAYALVGAHAIIDTLAMIPAYLAGVGTLLLLAWKNRVRLDAGSDERRSYELITLASLANLVAIAMIDVLENFFTWYVVDRAWRSADLLTEANVRILWFLSFSRYVLVGLLAFSGVLLVALGRWQVGRMRSTVVAVRSELVVIGVLAIALLVPPQTADMIRGWHVSQTLITVMLVIVLSLLLRWTSANALRLAESLRRRVVDDEPVEPRRVRLPVVGARPKLGTFVGVSVLTAALGQVILVTGFRVSVGLGLLIPASIVGALWVLGLAVPPAPYVRGDREIGADVHRRLPRLLGSATYVVVGVAILNAAVGSVVYARHEDWYLLFALTPPAIGLWRVHTRTTHQMTRIEPAFATAVVVLGMALLLLGDPELSPAALTFAGITFAYGSLAFFNSYEPGSTVSRVARERFRDFPIRPFTTAAALVLGATILGLVTAPISVAPRLGSVGVLLIAMIVLALVGALSIRFAELSEPPKILAAFRIRRIPMLTIILAWLVLAPTLTSSTVNDIRIMNSDAGGVPPGSVRFDDVFDRWSSRNLDGAHDAGAERPVVPFVLVSTSGGGIRAAVWTSFVLDCIFEAAPTDEGSCAARRSDAEPALQTRIAVMSGVSGGALGLASYLSYLLEPSNSDAWVKERLGDDYLAPAASWLLFVDIPRSLLGFGEDLANRSAIMELAWEASWDHGGALNRGLGDLWHTEPGLPLVILNATSVHDGCRFNSSVLDVDGDSPDVSGCGDAGAIRPSGGDGSLAATYDLTDFLCDNEDVRLSTAVSMSARYPVVASSARVSASPECGARRSNVAYVVDGAYFEGSGAETLLDSWKALAGYVDAHNADSSNPSCVVPFMLHIDNGYESPSPVSPDVAPREFLVPLMTLLNSQGGRLTSAREEAAIEFERPFSIAGRPIPVMQRTDSGMEAITSRYTRLVTQAHPGVQAPLGWTLSGASIDDLQDQLEIDSNLSGLAEVRSWLSGDLVCVER